MGTVEGNYRMQQSEFEGPLEGNNEKNFEAVVGRVWCGFQ
jgi:hypothetical protein